MRFLKILENQTYQSWNDALAAMEEGSLYAYGEDDFYKVEDGDVFNYKEGQWIPLSAKAVDAKSNSQDLWREADYNIEDYKLSTPLFKMVAAPVKPVEPDTDFIVIADPLCLIIKKAEAFIKASTVDYSIVLPEYDISDMVVAAPGNVVPFLTAVACMSESHCFYRIKGALYRVVNNKLQYRAIAGKPVQWTNAIMNNYLHETLTTLCWQPVQIKSDSITKATVPRNGPVWASMEKDVLTYQIVTKQYIDTQIDASRPYNFLEAYNLMYNDGVVMVSYDKDVLQYRVKDNVLEYAEMGKKLWGDSNLTPTDLYRKKWFLFKS